MSTANSINSGFPATLHTPSAPPHPMTEGEMLAALVTHWRIVLFGIALVGLLLRLIHLGENSLWGDELHTLASSLGHSIDPDAWALQGKQFDPLEPVTAGYYQHFVLEPAVSLQHAGWSGVAQSITQTLRTNIHPPLFYLITRWMMEQFGTSALVIRALPVLFGVLCLPLFYSLVYRWGRGWQTPQLLPQPLRAQRGLAVWTALLATALFAFADYQVLHSQDARSYTLITLLALAMFRGVTALLDRLDVSISRHQPYWHLWPVSGWLGLGLLALIGLYTQYLFVIFLAALAGMTVWESWQRTRGLPSAERKRYWQAVLLAGGLVTVLVAMGFLPWLPEFTLQREFFKTVGHFSSGLWNPTEWPEFVFRNMSAFVLTKDKVLRVVLFIMLALGGGQAVKSLWTAWRCQSGTAAVILEKQKPQTPAALAQCLLIRLLWWIGLYLLLQTGLDILQDTATLRVKRYMLLVAPAVYALVAYGVTCLQVGFGRASLLQRFKALVSRRASETFTRLETSPITGIKVRLLLSLILIFWLLGHTLEQQLSEPNSSDDFKAAARWIEARLQPTTDQLMVYKSGASTVGLSYYLNVDTPMQGMNPVKPSFEGTGAPVSLTRQLPQHLMQWQARKSFPPSLYFAFSHVGDQADGWVQATLEQSGYQRCDKHKVKGVRLYRYCRAEGL